MDILKFIAIVFWTGVLTSAFSSAFDIFPPIVFFIVWIILIIGAYSIINRKEE